MQDLDRNTNDLCAIYVDMGTTNTRVWVLRGDEVLAFSARPFGVRDAAQAGSTTALRSALGKLISEVRIEARKNSKSCEPICIVAAGMISSSLGLVEVPYVQAPAGLPEISAGIFYDRFTEVSDLPLLLAPGVRCGPKDAGSVSFDQIDVMRGEETLCLGLQALGLVEPPAVVLTLGSHWKAITISGAGQISNSSTSLSGEMIQAIKGETILASALSHEWPKGFSQDWLLAGMAEQRRSGLPRALFCVRLLKLEQRCPPDQRFAFLLGAFIAADLDPLVRRGFFQRDTRVVISGHPVTAAAWALALDQISVDAVILTEQQVEAAFLAGLKQMLMAQIANGTLSATVPLIESTV
jgi:2-dehydro-3-deoxygalactonokinase